MFYFSGYPVYLAAAELCICVYALAQPCPEPFGSDLQEQEKSSENGLFLDLDNRAPCSGTVTAYHYCYYDLDTDAEAVVAVFFMVYRQNGNRYTLVDGSWHKTQNSLVQVGFACEEEPLEEVDQFQVEENDIIAACTVDTSSTRPLSVLAENAQGYSLQRLDIDTGDSDGCLPSELNAIEDSELEERSPFALHLFADIGKVFS